MKKVLCTILMCVLALGCFAGCTDHEDGECDDCGAEHAFQIPGQGDDELCAKCWAEKGVEQW